MIAETSLAVLLENPSLRFKTGQELLVAPKFDSGCDASGIDARFSGDIDPLQIGPGVHEWFFSAELDSQKRIAKRFWLPPLTLLSAIAGRVNGGFGAVLFVDRNCWPATQIVQKTILPDSLSQRSALNRCICVHPHSDTERLWVIQQALRCSGVAAVVANGQRFDATATRRLQLAAETGHVTALLARPPWEIADASWAATRWQVTPDLSVLSSDAPRWNVELIRGKGMPLNRHWTFQWNHEAADAKNSFDLSAGVGRGVYAPQPQTAERKIG